MRWSDKGSLRIGENDLAVMRQSAFACRDWTQPHHWTGPGESLPPVPSAAFFVLLVYDPQTLPVFWKQYRRVLSFSNHPEQFYDEFLLDMGNKSRAICSPRYDLAACQYWILRRILEKCPVSESASAYRKGRSLRDNAAPHAGKKILVRLDIRHFFDSVTYGKVFSLFRDRIGYPEEGAALLAHLCCVHGHLPQGACTSPALSNLCMAAFDREMEEYGAARGIAYTRYSDDMTFSADAMDTGALIRYVRERLRRYGFRLHEGKIRVDGPGTRHQVTGVVCNRTLRVPAETRRKIRQEMYYLERFGPREHILRLGDPRFLRPDGSPDVARYKEHLLGRIHYVLQINPPNREFREYACRLSPGEDRPILFLPPDGPEDLPF